MMEQATVTYSSAPSRVEYIKRHLTFRHKRRSTQTITHIPFWFERPKDQITLKDRSFTKRMRSIGCSTVKDNAVILYKENSQLQGRSIKSVSECPTIQAGHMWIRPGSL